MKTPPLGFTLVELLISLTILALMIGAGLPGLQGFVANNKADNQYRQLFTLLQFARSQSVHYREPVVVCPSLNEQDCINNWQYELLVFVDKNNNKIFDEDDLLLKKVDKTEKKSARIVNAFPTSRHLSFNYNGRSGNQNGRLTYCVNSKKLYANQIIIAKSGRIRKGDKKDALTKCSA